MFIACILGLVGLVLIYLEFYVPGGIAAVIGSFFFLSSVAWFGVQTADLLWTFIYFIVLVVLVIIVCKLALLHIRSMAKNNSLYSAADQEGYVASAFKKELVGKKGVCISNLKPSGHILIEGMQEQAISETGYLEKGTDVIIIGGQGSHLIVKPINKEKQS